MAQSVPNDSKVWSGEGAALVAAQERARGTYKDRVQWGTVVRPSPQKSTVSPFKGTSGG
jgi:hypothetical protein